MKQPLVMLLGIIAMSGMLDAVSRRKLSLRSNSTDTLQEVEKANDMATMQAEDQAECQLLLPALSSRIGSDQTLMKLCQEAFSSDTCDEAHQGLSVRPWSKKAIKTTCLHLTSAGSWRSHVRLGPLLLQRRARVALTEMETVRQRLDASLHRKGQDTIKQPPYTEYESLPDYKTKYNYYADASTLPKSEYDDQKWTASRATGYKKTGKVTYVEGLGTKDNADLEDAVMWCWENGPDGSTPSTNCPPTDGIKAPGPKANSNLIEPTQSKQVIAPKQIHVMKTNCNPPEWRKDADRCSWGALHFSQVGMRLLSAQEVGCDPLFPSNSNSISRGSGAEADPILIESSNNPNLHRQIRINQWVTFQEFANLRGIPQPHSQISVLGKYGPRAVDIYQGEVGDGPFQSCVIAVALQHSNLIDGMFVDRNQWAQNIYTTQWLLNGKKTKVSVDNTMPTVGDATARSMRAAFADPSNSTGGFWPTILEKAFAKIFGSYEKLHSGYEGTMLQAMTGAPTTKILMPESYTDDDAELVWNQLKDATEKKYVVVCTAKNSDLVTTMGVKPGQSYALVGAWGSADNAEAKKARLIQLRAPVKQTSFKGAPTGGAQVAFEDFMKTLASFTISKVQRGYELASMVLPSGVGITAQARAPTGGPLTVSIFWQNWRLYPCEAQTEALPSMVLAADVKAIKSGSKALHTFVDAQLEGDHGNTIDGLGIFENHGNANLNRYNAMMSTIDNENGGAYDIFTSVDFPEQFKQLESAHLAVYGPRGTTVEPSISSEATVALELLGPMQKGEPCKTFTVQAGGKAVTLGLHEKMLTMPGIPTYWSTDGKMFAMYDSDALTGAAQKWRLVDAHLWHKVDVEKKPSAADRKVAGALFSKDQVKCVSSKAYDNKVYQTEKKAYDKSLS